MLYPDIKNDIIKKHRPTRKNFEKYIASKVKKNVTSDDLLNPNVRVSMMFKPSLNTMKFCTKKY